MADQKFEIMPHSEKQARYGKYFNPYVYLGYFPFGESWEVPDQEVGLTGQWLRFKVRVMKSLIDAALQSKKGSLKTLDLSTGPHIGKIFS